MESHLTQEMDPDLTFHVMSTTSSADNDDNNDNVFYFILFQLRPAPTTTTSSWWRSVLDDTTTIMSVLDDFVTRYLSVVGPSNPMGLSKNSRHTA